MKEQLLTTVITLLFLKHHLLFVRLSLVLLLCSGPVSVISYFLACASECAGEHVNLGLTELFFLFSQRICKGSKLGAVS